MNFAVLRRPRTQALLDGTSELPGLPARWHLVSDPLGWALQAREGHRDLAAGELDGGEMSISSFVQAKSRAAPLVALPIFLKRGLVQRSLFCAVGSALRSPAELAGKRVGLVSQTSSMAAWMRGILHDAHGVPSKSIQWFSVIGPSGNGEALTIPAEFSAPQIEAWEELDGYPHTLDRREAFLFSLLGEGKLDAVVSFQARIDSSEFRPLLDEESLWSHPLSSQIYPINHLFVVKSAVLDASPAIAESLLSAFRKARRSWTAYQPQDERQPFEREAAKLGYDPFEYQLGEVERKTLETFVRYLHREKLIAREPGLDEFFYRGL